MSFILDALKKSETDRQRHSGPALFEVKVAPPRSRLPPWALGLAVLLVVNVGIVAWLVLRRPGAAVPVATAPPPAAPSAAAPVATASTGPVAPTASAASAVPAGPTTPAGSAVPAAPATSAASAGPAALTAGAAPPAGSPTTQSPARPGDAPNPDDYAPATEAAEAPLGGHVRRGTASGVPLYQDAAAAPGARLPQLRLDLHAYAVRPQDRFVMINMHKLREGETSPEGARVESITPDGAVLSYHGSSFLLPRQ